MDININKQAEEVQAKKTVKFFGIKINIFGKFSEFIKEYGVVGLAIGVVLGTSVTKFVNSIVENLVSPIIGIVLSANTLSNMQWGPVKIGSFLSSLIEFIIVLIIIFFSVRYVLRFLKLVEDKKAIHEANEKEKSSKK